jgi:hypothetical protein
MNDITANQLPIVVLKCLLENICDLKSALITNASGSISGINAIDIPIPTSELNGGIKLHMIHKVIVY